MLYFAGTLLVLIGLAICFFGFKLFKLWLSLCGIALGGVTGLVIGLLNDTTGVMLLVAVLIGVIIMLVIVNLAYRVAIAISGFMTGYTVAYTLAGLVEGVGLQRNFWIALTVGVLFGLFALIFQKYYVVYATSINGATLAARSAVAMFVCKTIAELKDFIQSPEINHVLIIVTIMIALTVSGVIVQLKLRKKPKKVETMQEHEQKA